MIHLTLQGGPEVLVLCQHDIDRLRGGHQVITGARSVMVTFTPDETRAATKINDDLIRGPITPERFDALMREVYKETADARQDRQPAAKGPASNVGAPATDSRGAGG